MTRSTWSRLWAVLLAFGLIAAACGDDDDGDDTETETSETTVADEGTEDEGTETTMADEEEAAGEGEGEEAMGSLADVCPSPLIIQTDWYAESEHGALYNLVGDDYTVDAENLVVSGSMVLDGEDLGIDIEVRSGGPAIGFAAPRVQMYTDDSIHLGYSNTDSQSTNWEDLPLIAVVAPLEINPQIIMWDPDTYPEIETIADLGEAGVTVRTFSLEGFSEAFVAQGIWSQDQVDPSYDGTPAVFIAQGDVAQQGFASAEPYNYEFVFEEYGKAPRFQLLHDAGWQVYSQTLGVKPSELENLRPCLEQFVPVVQRSVVSFASDPSRANGVIVDAVATFDREWVYSAELAEWSAQQQLDLGLIGNGPDSTVGNMEESRIQAILDAQREAGVDIPEDLTAADMFTNEFIDDSIGL
jgi:hypothetical protein